MLFDGASVSSGGYLHGYLTSASQYCGQLSPTLVTAVSAEAEYKPVHEGGTFKIYPNPNDGNFTLEWPGSGFDGTFDVEIFGILGGRKMKEKISSGQKHAFSIPELPRGIYLVRVTGNAGAGILKMIRQ